MNKLTIVIIVFILLVIGDALATICPNPPTVSVSPSTAQPVCGSQTATFTCTTTTPGATVQFQIVGGATVGPSNTGSVQLVLGVNDIGKQFVCVATKGGCTTTSNPVQVVAGTPPTVSISPASPQALCGSQTVTYTCTTTTAGATVQFKVVGGPTVTPSNPGSVQLVLGVANIGTQYECVATTQNGCKATAGPVQVIAGTPPTVSVSPASPQPVCGSQTVTFTCTTTTSGATVQFKIVGGATVGPSNPGSVQLMLGVNNIGTQYVCVATKDGCTTTSNPVQVVAGTPPTVSVSPASPQSVCGSQTATFTCTTTTPGATVQFKIVGGATVGPSNPGSVQLVLGVANIGTQYVCVATKDGCTTTSNPVQVVAGTPPNVSVSPSTSQTVCGSQTVTFTCTTTTPGATVQFRIVGGATVGPSNSGSVQLVLGVPNIGTLYVCVATKDGCTATSNPVQVVQGNNPPTPTISASPTAVCYPLTCATLTCQSSVPGVTYTFYSGGTAIASNQASNTLKVCPSTTTSYTCSVAKSGCSSSQSSSTTVQVTNVGCSAGNSPPHKVNICHFPGQKGNDKSQCIDINGFLNGHCPNHPTDYATPSATCGATSPNPACTCSAILAAISAGNGP